MQYTNKYDNAGQLIFTCDQLLVEVMIVIDIWWFRTWAGKLHRAACDPRQFNAVLGNLLFITKKLRF